MDLPSTSIAVARTGSVPVEVLLGALAALATPVRVLDAQGTPIWANAAWEDGYGGASGEARVHPDDRARSHAARTEAVETRARRESLHRLQEGEGWAWVRERIVPCAVGGERFFVVSIERVDDERRELEAVRVDADATLEALELVLASTGAVLATVDRTGRLLRISEGFGRVQGEPHAALLGRRVDTIGGPLGPAIAAALARMEAAVEGVHLTEYHDRAARRWWSVGLQPSGGQIAVSAVEITRRKRQEQQLQLAEKRLRLAVAAAPLTLFHCDRKLRYTWVSRPLKGQSTGELLGLTPRDVFGPEAEPLERLLRRVLRTGSGAHREIRISGEQRPARFWECWAEPQRDDDGRPAGVMVVALESTARRASEAALRESEERFRGTFENAGVGVAHVSASGRILRINRRFCEILGFQRDDLLDRQIHDFVHPDDWPAVERLDPPEAEGRIRFFRRDGDEAWLLLTLSHSGDMASPNGHVIVVAQDVTPQVRAERMLKELTSTLEQQVARRTARLERQAEILRRLAAELTTTEQRERKRLAEMLHDHLQQYLVAARLKVGMARRRASEAVGTLLEDADAMLGEAVKSARTLTVELRPPVLYEDGLIPALRWLASRVRKQHGLEVALDADPEAEPVEEHVRALLYAAIQELLLNVVKHAGVSEAEVVVALEGDELHVVVRDRGRGFEPGRLDLERAPTGFGIVSVRERLTALDGRMDVVTAPDRGTAVHLHVPMGERAPSLSSDDDRVDRVAVRPLARNGEIVRVLLADDHKIVREGLGTLLEEQPGIQIVAHAADGQEAVELTAALQPDVVVMDVNMPRMNGIEATRVIAQRWPHVAVVGLSVHDEAGTAESMYEAGACAYLYKGGDPGRLIETVLKSARPVTRA